MTMNISQLSEFITNHPMLILAAVALLAMLVGGELKRRISGVKDVGPGEATRLLNHDNAIMVDMRSDGLRKAVSGQTTIEEIERVTQSVGGID